MTQENPNWTFLSNYAHVLVCVAENPEIRLREIATLVNITERSTQRIINHLKEAGILYSIKNGRRNHYLIDLDQQLRHPIEEHCDVATLLAAIIGKSKISKVRKQYAESREFDFAPT
jgi:predicted transcriptional regulator